MATTLDTAQPYDKMIVEVWNAGYAARENGVGGDDCPYAFNRSPFWETKDYEGFDREWRQKLDAWMGGWISANREYLKGTKK